MGLTHLNGVNPAYQTEAEGEQMQVDLAHDHVDTIKNRVQGLLESNEVNFNSWILLITEVDDSLPDEIQKICIVYDSFLSEFPLCYGYWIRYAAHKARLCTLNEVEEVYERAVKAASHSIHLWVSYCSFGILSFEDPADVRRLFQRGLSYVAKDYFCHLLWDKYIEFEYSQKQWSRLAHIYINTLSFPSRRLLYYFESFKKLVALLEEHMGFKNVISATLEAVPDNEMTHMMGCGYAEISNVVDLLSQSLPGPEILKKFLSIGELLYQKSCHLDKRIQCFEAHIKRRHFHMKPLDEFQLENWHNYLNFVEDQGNFEWTVKLYERCLIPCANYSEFWIRYVDFVDGKGGREIANNAIDRALKVFLKRIPAFHQYYSMFKEKIGDTVTASVPFLQSDEDFAADVVENVSRKANMEKRMGNIQAAQDIYDKAIKMAHEKHNLKTLSHLYISLARFTFVVTGSVNITKEVYIKGIQQNPSKLIIEGFLDFMTIHGGMNHVNIVKCMMTSLLSSESEISQALNSHDLEEISQLYLKFIDLYGTIHEIRKAWECHMKLFPHIMRPSSISDNSSSEFRAQGNKTERSKDVPTSSPNNSNQSPDKTVLAKHLIESPLIKSINFPEEVLKCEQKPYEAGNGKGRQEFVAVEAVSVKKLSIPQGSEINIVDKFLNEIPNVAQIPDASSEYHENEIPIQSCVKEECHGNIEPPALDNLSMANPLVSCDNSTPHEVTSKMDGNKHEDDSEASLMRSSPHENWNCELNSQAKPLEDSSLSYPASHAASTITKEDLRSKFQEKISNNQALPVNAEHPQTAPDGGQLAQVYHGIQGIADSNTMLHGYFQSSRPQQWQTHAHVQNQSSGTNLQMSVNQSYVSQNSPLMNSQDPQANHTQVQFQVAASQAYANPSLPFLGQHMQQPAILYTQDQQLQQSSSHTHIQAYQNVSQSDGQYGYYENVQGYPPHIWQYYQNLYYLQQQQMQQRQQDQQVILNSHKQQWTDPSHARSSQQELVENQEEKSKLHIQPDIQQCNNIDYKINAAKQQQNQQEKLEEKAQLNQQSTQVMNYEQSQVLYLQQQQLFYLQHQQQQMYLQQQHLFQQQQCQQHQQHQQLLVSQQQQLLQFQHQQQMPISTSQQEEPQCTQQQQFPLQQHNKELQQQNNALELEAVESNAYSQGKGDAVQSAGQSANSCST